MNNEFMDNNNIENKEKANELLSLRTTKTKKEFIENYKIRNGFKTADELIDKIIKLMSNEKVNETEKKFTLDEDMKIINKSIENIKSVIEGISGKVNSEIDDTIRKTNDKLEQKDAVLNEAESMLKNMMSAAEQQFESFKKENDELAEELEGTRKELVTAKSNILSLEKENEDKDIIINQLTAEKTKFDVQLADCVEAKKEMQVKINSLLALEEKNKQLKAKLEEVNESNRNLKAEIAIKDNTIVSKEDIVNKLNADLESIKSALANKEQELSILNEECRNEVANMTIEFKEKILEAKFEAKDDAEKKYESKIEKLKDEVYNLKKELESFKSNKK